MADTLPPPLPQPLPPSPLPLPLPRLPPSPPPPPCPLSLLAFWLTVVCPRAASATATVSLPPTLLLLAADAIVTVTAAADLCTLLLPPQALPLCIPLFSLMMFKILLRPTKYYLEHLSCHFLVDCCLPLRCLCFCHRCLPPQLRVRQPPHCNRNVRCQQHELPVLESSTITSGSDATPAPNTHAKKDNEDKDYRRHVAAA